MSPPYSEERALDGGLMDGLPLAAPLSWLDPRLTPRPLDSLDQDSDCSDCRTAQGTGTA